jgi:hypothetical protein
MFRHFPWFLTLLLFLGLGSIPTLAQSPQYKVLSSKEVFLYDPNGAVSSVQTVDRATGKVTQAASATQVQPASSWWDVVFPSDVFTITTPAQNLDLDYSVAGKAAPSMSVSLSLKVSIAIGTNGSILRTYFLNSNIVLQNSKGYLIANDSADCGRYATGGPKVFALKDKSKTKALHGTLWSCTVPVDQIRLNPAQAGAIKITLDYSLIWRQNSFTIDADSGNALLGGITVDPSLIPGGTTNSVAFADDSTFNPQSGPTTKDAASVYANLQIAAGTGAKGAWGIDGKIAYWNVPVAHGALTVLSATANTGNNTSNIKSSTYTDTIDWMLPVSWAFSLWKQAPTTLTVIVGPKYETDYKFDKKNLLLTADTVWSAAKLYQPQSYRSKPQKGVLPKWGDKDYAKFGYELEFHAGVESGGALIDTTTQNTKKTQSINVPSYAIERVVPQIHALYQQTIFSAGLLTFDSTLTSRYLLDKENTVREATDGSLSIKQVSGWKAINTLTTTWNPPKSANVGLTVTYKDGFDAPKFSRVNSVLIGVLLEF